MTAKTPTPQAISALLRKAGFEKSETRPTAVKGWREWSEGYRVSKDADESRVCVEWRPSSFRRDGSIDADRARMHASYAEVIINAGFGVSSSLDRWLIVTAKTETTP